MSGIAAVSIASERMLDEPWKRRIEGELAAIRTEIAELRMMVRVVLVILVALFGVIIAQWIV